VLCYYNNEIGNFRKMNKQDHTRCTTN